MQEMKQQLTHLEDRQMKFFLETQQKVKRWRLEREGLAEGKNNPHKHPLDTEVKDSEERV